MSDKLNNIFSETDCLSPATMIAYTENRMSAENRYLVEKHLADCELCTDAMDGLTLVKNKMKLPAIFKNINLAIDKRVKKKNRKIINFDFRVKLVAAALLIAVVGVTIIFRYYIGRGKNVMVAQRTDEELPLKNLEKNTKEQANKNETRRIIDSEIHINERLGQAASAADGDKDKDRESNPDIPFTTITITASGKAQAEMQEATGGFFRSTIDEQEKSETKNDLFFSTSQSEVNKNNLTNNELDKQSKIAVGGKVTTDSIGVTAGYLEGKSKTTVSQAYRQELSKEEKQSDNKNNDYKKAVSKSNTMANEKTIDVPADGTTALSDQRYATAVQKYQSNDYGGSKELLESYIEENPDDYNALYYCGVSYYFLNQYDNAAKYLQKVLKTKTGSFYETAKWYLALSYIGKKENKQAEKLLNDIIKDSSSLKEQAMEKLLDLKK